MNTEEEIQKLKAGHDALQGEAIAVQAVLNGFLGGLASASPEGRALVTNAFNYADHFAEIGAMSLGASQPPAHLLGFMQTLELMRKTALGGHGEPQGGV